MSEPLKISCVIISYNCLESLEACIESIRKQEGLAYEIIVVDNDSSDGTAEYLKSADLKPLFPGENIGYGAAANLGAKEAKGEYILILNPDIELAKDALAALYSLAESDKNIGLISPILENPDGTPQLSARKFPGRRDFFVGRGSPLFKLGLTGEKTAGYIVPDGDQPIEVPAVSATAILISRKLFGLLGGFDPRFFLYLEDIDLCRRVSAEGFRIMLHPGVRVKHVWRSSSRKRPYFAIYHHHISVGKYFRKHYPRQWFYNIILYLALAGGLVVSFAIKALKPGDKG